MFTIYTFSNPRYIITYIFFLVTFSYWNDIHFLHISYSLLQILCWLINEIINSFCFTLGNTIGLKPPMVKPFVNFILTFYIYFTSKPKNLKPYVCNFFYNFFTCIFLTLLIIFTLYIYSYSYLYSYPYSYRHCLQML